MNIHNIVLLSINYASCTIVKMPVAGYLNVMVVALNQLSTK